MYYQILKSNTSTENIIAYSKLLSRVFNKNPKFTPEFLLWQYSQNPNGSIIGSDAFFNGELIAHHATIPVVYSFFGKQYKGILAINNVTHPDHQGKGLLTELGNATFNEAKRLNYDFVITVTNANSTHGYLNKFGFRLISPLAVKIGFGKIIPLDIRTQNVYSCWTKESLAWRLKNPAICYHHDNQSILAKVNKIGLCAQLKYLDILEIDELLLKSHKSNFNIWIGLSKEKKESGMFFNMPDFLKPSPLNLLFKDLQGNIPIFGKGDICFELADFDAF